MKTCLSQKETLFEIGSENRLDSWVIEKECGLEHKRFLDAGSHQQEDFQA
jgi:hypothetical protein